MSKACIVAALAALPSFSFAVSRGQAMTDTMAAGSGPGVTVTLGVTVSGKAIAATLVYENRSGADVFIDRRKACLNGRIEDNVFQVSSDGKDIAYRGTLAKRRRPTADDFAKLVPGQSLMTEVRLDRAYAFLNGRHEHRVTYSAFQQYPNRELVSNTVKLAATR